MAVKAATIKLLLVPLLTSNIIRVHILAAAILLGLTAGSCSRISGVNPNGSYVAAQAQKAQQLLHELDTRNKVVDAEKQKLKAHQYQFDGAKKNLKGRKLAAE